MTARMPLLPINAAVPFTLRSTLSVLLVEQADKLPDSKPSAKIWSGAIGSTLGVRTTVEIEVLVAVAAPNGVWVTVTADVGGVEAGVSVIVGVAIGADVDVRVVVGICPTPLPTQLALPESVKVCPAIGTNCQS